MLVYYGTLSIRAGAWLVISFEVTKIMTKEQTDRMTLGLLAYECRPGRPKTDPLSRDERLCINRRNRLKCDKVRGFKRVEPRLNAGAVGILNELAESRNMSRNELVEEILVQQLVALRSQGTV